MTNYDILDPLSQGMIDQTTQSNNSYVAPDLNLSENVLEQAADDAEVTSYDASVNTMQTKINQGFIDRQNYLLENHIHPEASLDDGITQDKLDILDKQIAKINATTRVRNPILTNDQVKQKVKNQYLRAVYEQQAGSEHENMATRAVSGALGFIEGAHYDYKKALIDVGSMVATGLAASATGGGSLLAEAAIGGAGIATQDTIDQARQNPALKLIGLPTKDLYQTAKNGFISGAIGTAGAILGGKVLGKIAGKALKRFVSDSKVEGYGSSTGSFSPLSASTFKKAGTAYDAVDGEVEGVNPDHSEMYVDDVKEATPEMKSAMKSQDPNVRAAAQDRILKSNTMVENLEDNEVKCNLKSKS